MSRKTELTKKNSSRKIPGHDRMKSSEKRKKSRKKVRM